jgi:MinD superfamily P-loop ATPase
MKTLPNLLKECQRTFNEYIRLRDLAGCSHFKCIACGKIKDKRLSHASHYYNVGYYQSLRFDEDNCHIGCSHCNTFLHGNLIEYRKNLPSKIGLERFNLLEIKAGEYRRKGLKWDRFSVEYKIEELRQKIKELEK